MNNSPEEQRAPQARASIKDSVLERITTGATPMRSRAYFILKIVALVVVTFAVLIVSVAVCNFILFSLRINAPGPALGPQGFLVTLTLFPWLLLILDIVLVAILEWLLRQFRFGYRSPFIYLILGTLAVVIAVSAFIDRATPFNDDLLHRADQHQLPPPFRDFIEGERQPPPPGSGIYKGTIISIDQNVLSVRALGTSTPFVVTIDPNDPSLGMLRAGDVVLFGGHATYTASTTMIQTRGVQLLPSESAPPPAPR